MKRDWVVNTSALSEKQQEILKYDGDSNDSNAYWGKADGGDGLMAVSESINLSIGLSVYIGLLLSGVVYLAIEAETTLHEGVIPSK